MDLSIDKEGIRRIRSRRRRKIWFSVLGVCVVLITLVCLYNFTDIIAGVTEEAESAPQSVGEWTMFRNNLDHTGSTGDNSIVPEGNLLWTFSAEAAIHSSPTVVDGIVYFGSRDHYFYALNAATGELLWSYETGSWVESSAIVVGDTVYFGSNDGKLYALDAKTGEKRWEFSVIYPIISTPAYADGMIYFGCNDYNVYAVDAATGQKVWSNKTDNIVQSSPAVSGGIVAVGSMDSYFYTFNAKNGRARLKYSAFSSIVSSPAVQGNVAYVLDSSGQFYALDITQKNWLWENKLRVYWNALYIYGTAPKPSPPSGLLWNLPMGWMINSVSSVALMDDHAYMGVGAGVFSLDLSSRQVVWNFMTSGLVSSSPAVTREAIFIGDKKGRFYALDRNNGDLLWEYLTDDIITSSPVVVDGIVYFTSEDGKIYAFK